METDALGALVGIDDIDCLTLADRVVGTLWLTSATANAFVRYLIRHEECLLLTWGSPPLQYFTGLRRVFFLKPKLQILGPGCEYRRLDQLPL